MAILVDTNSVSREERIGYWRNTLGRLLDTRVRIDIDEDAEFDARLAIHRIDRVSLAEMVGGPMSLTAGATSATPEITVLVALHGSVLLNQGAQRCSLSAGEICLCSTRLPIELELTTSAHLLWVSVPEQEFLDLFPQGRQALARTICAGSGAPAVFVDHANALIRRRDSLDPASARAIADSLVHLMGSVACFAAVGRPDCVRQARERIERVLRFARANLRDPDLDVEAIARAVHLSPRQVHRLFTSEPMSVMQWVLAQRLDNCRRELEQDSRRRSISEIAYGWGFSDQAHFSRAFRKRFGHSPSELRRPDRGAGAAPPYDIAQCTGCHFRSIKTSP